MACWRPFWACFLVFMFIIFALFCTSTSEVLQGQSNGGIAVIHVEKILKTILSVRYTPPPEPNIDSTRHREEKVRLLKRLSKSSGKYNSNHPRQRLLAALHGFFRYKQRSLSELNRIKDFYRHVPEGHRNIVESVIRYEASISTARDLIDVNTKVTQAIFSHALAFYDIRFSELTKYVDERESGGKQAELVSVSQALKHFVRDWSVEGEHERIAMFPQILENLKERFPNRTDEHPVRVLVPGAGVGRLAHDIAALGGFEVTANEWSSYMNIAYRYLASPSSATPFSSKIHPFVDWWSHQPTRAELHREISFPDVPVNPPSVLWVEGDFTTTFNGPEHGAGFDAVVTLFFIDTARNIMSYLTTIHHVLKKSTETHMDDQGAGIWLNLGPLLWGSAPFLQLSLEEIVQLSEAVGFSFLDTDPRWGDLTIPGLKVRGKEAPYGFNENALSKNAYVAQFWIAKAMIK